MENLNITFQNSSNLLIRNNNITFSEATRFIWIHNERIIEDVNDTRISFGTDGELSIDDVIPNDAGYYEIIVFNEHMCKNMIYTIFIECKLYYNKNHS